MKPAAPELRDAIVVLGARLGPGGALTPVLRERISAAIDCFDRGGAPRIIVTGGVTRPGAPAEADAMAAALGDRPVVIERHARSTADNARLVAQLVPPRADLWLVTQPFHMRRALYLFRRAQLRPHAWRLPASIEYAHPSRHRWRLRELAAWLRTLVQP